MLLYKMIAAGSGCTFLVSGGRYRVILVKNKNNGKTYFCSNGGGSNLYLIELDDTGISLEVRKLIDIYGAIYNGSIEDDRAINFSEIDLLNRNWTSADYGYVDNVNIFDTFGFVEGQARIITDYGNIACVVKNGTLYPIITEYDQEIEDNKCLTSLYLNGDNEVSGLQDMIDHPGRYLPYDNTTIGEPWSAVENYLHQNVNMPIVPKIGFEPSPDVGIGNALPGLNYEVTL